MAFNECAKNFDDHTKNISFLMDKRGIWSLAPAYDVTFSYKKDSIWVSAHQMLIKGKANDVNEEDMYHVAENVGIKRADAKRCIEEVQQAIKKWNVYAKEVGMSDYNIKRIQEYIKDAKS